MACVLKYVNSKYSIATKETSNQCVIFKKGSSLSPTKGFVIDTLHLHVPLSCDIFDTLFSTKNVYKIDIRKYLKIDQLFKILRFDVEIVNVPFVCKKHFSKKYFIKYVNPTSDFVNRMRLVSTPDNKNGNA